MVKLNKIYTKTGDKGTTGLTDGSRVSKHSLRPEAYGTVDELNSTLGLVYFHIDEKYLEIKIENDNLKKENEKLKKKIKRLESK